MILVDTSVWADHFRRAEPHLAQLVGNGDALLHPFVLGEIAMGSLPNWERVVLALQSLPRIEPVSEHRWIEEVRSLKLQGSGLGFVDVHLIAGLRTTEGTLLWTRDKKLAAVAAGLGLAYRPGQAEPGAS